MMPVGGAARRSEQMALMSVLSHDMVTDTELSDMLDKAEAEDHQHLGTWDQANLREMRRQWVHANAVPCDLVAALSKACSTCEVIWRHARQDGDFAAVTRWQVLGYPSKKVMPKPPSWVREYMMPYWINMNPMNAPQNHQFLTIMQNFYPRFCPTCLHINSKFMQKPQAVAISAQEKLINHFAKCVGFDLTKGRLDKSAHPFSTGYKEDSRITVRYDRMTLLSLMRFA